MTADNLAALKVELTRDEGRLPRIYKDTRGHLTAGIGRNLDAVPFSDDEIDLMYENDVARAIGALSHRLPWWTLASPVRARVLCNLAFNLGGDGLLGFPKFLEAFRTEDYARASAELLDSRYARQVGARAQRLAYMVLTDQLATRGDGWTI